MPAAREPRAQIRATRDQQPLAALGLGRDDVEAGVERGGHAGGGAVENTNGRAR